MMSSVERLKVFALQSDEEPIADHFTREDARRLVNYLKYKKDCSNENETLTNEIWEQKKIIRSLQRDAKLGTNARMFADECIAWGAPTCRCAENAKALLEGDSE